MFRERFQEKCEVWSLEKQSGQEEEEVEVEVEVDMKIVYSPIFSPFFPLETKALAGLY